MADFLPDSDSEDELPPGWEERATLDGKVYYAKQLASAMEFPSLGNHCFEKSCNRLDFLPMKCDACCNVFCMDHFHYMRHSCNKAYQKDVQVPVCPLCNEPVPSKRGEQPDVAVSQHIDRDCRADPAIANRKIYTNKCSMKGCKQKEVIQLKCDTCRKNFCLKHRHQSDHKCQSGPLPPTPAQAAASAAMARAQNNMKQRFPWRLSRAENPVSTVSPISVLQAGMSEDEALARALQNSLIEAKPRNVQEEEDRLLAQALARNSLETNPSRQQSREKNCSVS